MAEITFAWLAIPGLIDIATRVINTAINVSSSRSEPLKHALRLQSTVDGVKGVLEMLQASYAGDSQGLEKQRPFLDSLEDVMKPLEAKMMALDPGSSTAAVTKLEARARAKRVKILWNWFNGEKEEVQEFTRLLGERLTVLAFAAQYVL